MKKFILSIALFFFLNVKLFSHVNHYASYNYLEYELFRNNQSIGYHKYDFQRDGDNLSIISQVSFKITKLGVDLYKYFAKSEENYKKGIFKSYYSKTKQNKKDRYVNIELDTKTNQLFINGSSMNYILNTHTRNVSLCMFMCHYVCHYVSHLYFCHCVCVSLCMFVVINLQRVFLFISMLILNIMHFYFYVSKFKLHNLTFLYVLKTS